MSWERAERRFDDPNDPGRLRHPQRLPYCCRHCDWHGKGAAARVQHWRDTGHGTVPETSTRYLPACDFCGKDVRVPHVLSGVGTACCLEHLDALEAQFTEARHGRRD